MMRRSLLALALMLMTACGTPIENASQQLKEQVRLGDPLAQQTYDEHLEILESAEALPIWVDALANDESAQVKHWAAQIIGNIADASALPALTAAMSDSRSVRDAAVAAIRQFDDAAAAGAFAQALAEGTRDAQVAALSQLSRLETGAELAVGAIAITASSSDELVARTAIDTLSDIASDESCAAIAAVAINAALDAEMRTYAVRALGRLQTDASAAQIDAVMATLQDADDDTSTDLLALAQSLR